MITRSNKKYNFPITFNKVIRKKYNKEYNIQLDKFREKIESIYDGSFFERVPLDDQNDKIRNSINMNDLEQINTQLDELQNNYQNSCPSVIDIIKTNLPINKKQELLEKIHLLTNSETLTPEYNSNLKVLSESIAKHPDQKLLQLENEINERFKI